MIEMAYQGNVNALDALVVRALYFSRRRRLFAKPIFLILQLLGIEIPPQVELGQNFRLAHSTAGVVLHSQCIIGDQVTIFHGVTLGRGDVNEVAGNDNTLIIVENDVTIGAGATVLVKAGRTLTLGNGCTIGAGAVITRDVGNGETWVGNPARKAHSTS